MRVSTWKWRPGAAAVAVALTGLAVAGNNAPVEGQEQIQAPEGYPEAGQPAVVRLLGAGVEPRRVLRLRFAEGDVARTEIVMHMAMTGEMGGMTLPVPPMPGMRMIIETRVTDIDEDGVISYDVGFVESGVTESGDSMMAAQLAPMLESLKAMKGSGRITNRGVSLARDTDLSAVADAQMRQTLSRAASVDQWVATLPEEAVGVGARWESRQRVSADVFTMFQRAEYEVIAIEDDRVSLKVTIEQSAPSQAIAAPQLPPEAEAWIQSYSGSGSGTAHMLLTALSAEGNSTVNTSMVMGFAMGGMEQAMTMGVTLDMTVKPVADGGGGD